MLLFTFVGGCLLSLGPVTAGSLDKKIAEIGDEEITQWDIDHTGTLSGGQGNPEQWLMTVARDRLGAQKAEEAGLAESSPELKWRLWSLETSIGVDSFLQDKVKDVTVEEKAVEEYYRDHKSQFMKPAAFSFGYIFCDTTEMESKSEIEKIRSQIQETHSNLVEAASPTGDAEGRIDSETFQRIGGDCVCAGEAGVQFAGPLPVDEPIQEIIKRTALALDPGQFSGVISTKYGFQILHLRDKTEAEVVMDYDEAKGRIQKFLEAPKKQERLNAYFADLKKQTNRYRIHRVQLEHQLPGSHQIKPESPYVVEIGDRKWEPGEFKEYMRTLHRRDWMMSHVPDKAIETTWEKLILPSLLAEDARQAGFVDQPTQVARLNYQKDQLLAYYWALSAANRKAAEMPRPSTEEYRRFYDENPLAFTIPEMYRIHLVEAPLSATMTDLSRPEKEFALRSLEETMRNLIADLIEGASSTELIAAWEERIPGISETTDWYAKNQKFGSEIWEEIPTSVGAGWIGRVFRTASGVGVLEVLDSREESLKPFNPKDPKITGPVKENLLKTAFQEVWKALEEEAAEHVEKVEDPGP